MSVKRPKKPTDIRGLPPTFDPDIFYRYAISRAMSDAVGLEWLLFKIMPFSLIRSLAFAIDPFSNFRATAHGKVAPAVRQRQRFTVSVLDRSTVDTFSWSRPQRTLPNWNGFPGRNSPMLFDSPPPTYSNSSTLAFVAEPLMRVSKDSTGRLRPIFSNYSEFVSSQAQVFSPSRYTSGYTITSTTSPAPPPTNDQKTILRTFTGRTIGPSASYIPSSRYNSIRNGEVTLAEKLIKDNVAAVFAQASPTRRNYTLFRNLVELRDLPRSIVSLRKTALDLAELRRALNFGSLDKIIHSFKTSASNIPDEYLSYMFGWRQLYSDVMGLLSSPDKISKDINYLIERSGRDATVRASKRVIPPSSNGIPGFVYTKTASDVNYKSESTRIDREAVIRVVLNTNFSFPSIMLPSFQKELFLRKLGLVPTVTDLYNLVPWTWLIDWFTGIGNYLDAVEQINGDSKLVNWAVVTCALKSKVTTDFQYMNRDSDRGSIGKSSWNVQVDTWKSHSSVMDLTTTVRKDVLTSMSGVRSTSDKASLTPYQNSILGALLAQRLKSPHR